MTRSTAQYYLEIPEKRSLSNYYNVVTEYLFDRHYMLLSAVILCCSERVEPLLRLKGGSQFANFYSKNGGPRGI
jgi:hypothetical protein